jgi:hypothetical protein
MWHLLLVFSTGIERHTKGDASLGKAGIFAGISTAQMIATLAEFGAEARIGEQDDLIGGSVSD